MSNALEKFIEGEIPKDVIWKDKMIELVIKAYKLGVKEQAQTLSTDDQSLEEELEDLIKRR